MNPALRPYRPGNHTKPLAEHRPMTYDELRQLASNPLIQVGGHTVNHPQLAALPVELQYDEIARDRKQLEIVTGRPVKTISYPFGEPDDFSPASVEVVQQAGFHAACSTQHMRIARGSDMFRLRRYWVGDWAAEDFQKRITEFLENRQL